DTRTVQEKASLEENHEEESLKFRFDLLSSKHKYLKGLLIKYSSLLSQERDINEKLEGTIRQLIDDISFIRSVVNNSIVESERLRKRNKFLHDQLIENGKLYNFNVELEPLNINPT
ncbi:403_t:CDS:1, partial [Funneliformis caledonium]